MLSVEAAAAVVEVGGLGLLVESDRNSLDALQPGEEAILYSRLLLVGATEPQPRLFGFATPEGRALFDLLRGVSGIGPGVALRLLGAQESPAEVAAALAAEDAKALKVKGVGPKLAKRVIAELKDKALLVVAASGALTASAALRRPTAPQAPIDRELEDAFRALVGLELPAPRARTLLSELRAEQPEADAEELLRAALGRI